MLFKNAKSLSRCMLGENLSSKCLSQNPGDLTALSTSNSISATYKLNDLDQVSKEGLELVSGSHTLACVSKAVWGPPTEFLIQKVWVGA